MSGRGLQIGISSARSRNVPSGGWEALIGRKMLPGKIQAPSSAQEKEVREGISRLQEKETQERNSNELPGQFSQL